jgi:phosphatidylserine/phosphatidylglycerophosphate/cardiolipin synthase-like enzyme
MMNVRTILNRAIILAAALLSPLFVLSGRGYSQSEFRLVESVPSETVLNSSTLESTIDVWMELTDNAKSSIDIETFYFADQENSSLNAFMTSLKTAAGRGVRIRIIVDSSFYASNDKSVDVLEGIENIEIRKIPMRNISGGVMHAKFFIVDGESVFAGSQNIDWRALMHIHEMGAVIKDRRIAGTFTEIFETDWKLCEGNIYGLTNMRLKPLVNRADPVFFNDKTFGEIEIYPAVSPFGFVVDGLNFELEELLRIINNSKESLKIQIYSYSTKDRSSEGFYSIDSALKNAAARGVKIKMLLPDWATKPGAIDAIKDLSTVPNISIKISSIPLHSSGFIPYARVDHSKYFVCDNDISWISTTNWERNYFYNSRNVSFVIKNSEVNRKLSEVFEISWESPYTSYVDVNKQYEEVKRK